MVEHGARYGVEAWRRHRVLPRDHPSRLCHPIPPDAFDQDPGFCRSGVLLLRDAPRAPVELCADYASGASSGALQVY